MVSTDSKKLVEECEKIIGALKDILILPDNVVHYSVYQVRDGIVNPECGETVVGIYFTAAARGRFERHGKLFYKLTDYEWNYNFTRVNFGRTEEALEYIKIYESRPENTAAGPDDVIY